MTFFPITRCKINNEMRAFLIKLLGNKPVTSTLLYSGHFLGWNTKDFHSRCDSKFRTVSLFQIEDGDCIGGYTSQCWESKLRFYGHKADGSAFLFNLTRSRHFPIKDIRAAIRCQPDIGPAFGNKELNAGLEPFNRKDNCMAVANELGYNIPIVDGKNQLTNQADIYFTISELEVWLLVDE